MIISKNEICKQLNKISGNLSMIKELFCHKDVIGWFADDFAVRFCWSSNSIEGNTLSLDETVSLLEFDEVSAGHTYSEYQDVKNLYSAICSLLIPFSKKEITEELIKKGNSYIRNTSGEYRRENNGIGTMFETAHIPPDFNDIPKLMTKFVEDANFEVDNLEGLFEALTVSHLTFERIHPFWDGNGRIGRIILNQQLINNSLLPIVISKRSDYIQGFKAYSKNSDISKLMYEIIKGECEAIERLNSFYQKWNKK